MNASNIAAEVAALRGTAGVLERPEVYTLVLTGADRVQFMNGMVTSDVAKLTPGQGQIAVKATSRGRVEGVLRVRMDDDALLVEVDEATAQAVADGLAKMIIMEDVALADGTPQRTVLSLVGPRAAEVLATVELPVPGPAHSFLAAEGVTVVRDDGFGPSGFELHVAPDAATAWRARLADAGATPVSAAALDVVRIEFGRPRDGIDIDADTIPMEARLDAALDFEKGCFVGQEVIARAHNLGGVKHILVGLAFEGDTPPPIGSSLAAAADGKATGEVTSAVVSPTFGRPIGLGYVRVAHQEVGTQLTVSAGDDGAAPVATAAVAPLPFEA